MKKILVIAAHPDDEVLGCGGTIAQEVTNGAKVKVVILATGATSRYKDPDKKVDKEVEALQKEGKTALSKLGVTDVVFAGFPDQKLDAVPILDIIHVLKDIVQSFKPDVLYTHHGRDYNKDHRVLFEAVLHACRPYLGEHAPKEVYAFEVLSSTEWGYQPRDSFRPNVFISLNKAAVEKKKKAMAAYKSELRKYPHPRSVEAIEILAKKRGLEISKEFAEAFELIRLFK